MPGGFGVTIFFFISGYIITKLLIVELQNSHQINLLSFYIRRLLRLYPALLFMIILFFSYLYYAHKAFNGHEVLASIFYYENYYNFNHPESTSTICKILWSLSVEEHFYLLFPIILLFLYKRPKILLTTMVMFIIIPLVFRYTGSIKYYYSADITERYTYTLTHTRFDSIIYGCLSSILTYQFKTEKYLKMLSNKLVVVVALVVLLFCLIFRDPLFRSTVRYSLQGLALFIVIPAIIDTSVYPKMKRLFSNQLLVFVGKMSYSIYLMHMIVINAVDNLKPQISLSLYYLIITLLTALLSLFVYHYIEKPFIKLRVKFKAKQKAQPALNFSN